VTDGGGTWASGQFRHIRPHDCYTKEAGISHAQLPASGSQPEEVADTDGTDTQRSDEPQASVKGPK
jgi:hypothetical protein